MKTCITVYTGKKTNSSTGAQGSRALAVNGTKRLLLGLALATAVLGSPRISLGAGPAPVDLRSTAPFTILSGAAITSTGGGIITGDVGASPIAGSAIGVTCAQVIGTIYAVDASGPAPCAVEDATLLTTAKGDLTTAYNDAAGRTVPAPVMNPGGGDIGGLNLAPGLYKFTSTANISTSVTLTGGPDDVWIFQCAADLQLASGASVILAGGAQAKNVFWQVGSSAVLGTFSSFQGTILASQSITMGTSSTIVGRLLAFSGGVTFNGTAGNLPVAPEIAVEQPPGTNLVNVLNTNDFGSVMVGTNSSLTFIITNLGNADLTGLGISIAGADGADFTVITNPVAPVNPGSNTTFTVLFTPGSVGLESAVLEISNNDDTADPFVLNLIGTGVGGGPRIGVSQPPGTNLTNGAGTNYFGSVVVGTNSSLTFTITNFGNANLTGLDINIDGAYAGSFTVTTNPVAPVDPGSNTTFTVLFTPAGVGVETAALHIANNDTNANPFNINLSGVGAASAAPRIGVSQPPGTNLTNGVGTNYFGSVVVGTNSSLTFTITNFGNANLIGLDISINGANTGSFMVTTNPVAPVVPGGSTTFTVLFAPTGVGVETAALHIANNDTNANPFNINLSGAGAASAAPRIGVSQPPGTNLTNGVGTNYFGSVMVGTNSSLTFTITNFGNANLTGLAISISGANTGSFMVITNPVAPVVPGGSTTFTVLFAPTGVGLETAALHIANNDTNANPFNLNLAGTGGNGGFGVSTNVSVFSASPITLNPQTGLFEQTVRLTNSSSVTAIAVRLLILNLPTDVQVYNASGNTNGTPFVQYALPLAPGASVSLLIEYYRSSRQAIPQPSFVIEIIAPITLTETGTIIAVTGDLELQSGRFLIEFNTIPGDTYAVQYSSDTVNWLTAIPVIVAPSNREQWYDDGPPKTDSKPGSIGSRFYRVLQLP